MMTISKEQIDILDSVCMVINSKYLKNLNLFESLMILKMLEFDITMKTLERNFKKRMEDGSL